MKSQKQLSYEFLLSGYRQEIDYITNKGENLSPGHWTDLIRAIERWVIYSKLAEKESLQNETL